MSLFFVIAVFFTVKLTTGVVITSFQCNGKALILFQELVKPNPLLLFTFWAVIPGLAAWPGLGWGGPRQPVPTRPGQYVIRNYHEKQVLSYPIRSPHTTLWNFFLCSIFFFLVLFWLKISHYIR
jgi:hypothetical protein